MSIVEELRSKASRDNRGLLDRAASEIEDLERNLEAAYAKIEALAKEKLLITGPKSNNSEDMRNKQSEGKWVARDCITESKRGRTIHYTTHQCSVCGKWNGRHKTNYCPNCGAKMKGGAE